MFWGRWIFTSGCEVWHLGQEAEKEGFGNFFWGGGGGQWPVVVNNSGHWFTGLTYTLTNQRSLRFGGPAPH